MATVTTHALKDQILVRRERLQLAQARPGAAAQVEGLLREVDAALARLDAGSFGVCETCQDPIESDRLMADPLVRYCLDHLTPAETQALQQDLDLAARIQVGLLPARELASGGWEIRYHYEPAGAVSGDYCDVVASSGRDLFFVLGDVSGKGVAASLLMSHLQAIFRSLIATSLALTEILARANSLFCESTMAPYYATLVGGRAGASGEVELCNAGHPPALLVRQNGVVRIDATGLPLGMFCSSQFATRTLRMEKGDTLLLYTDGLSEARSPAGEEYGVERLARVAAGLSSESAEGVLRACLRDLASHVASGRKADDLTLMAVRRTA
jgi:sigma-B regulation protein RsbU (phosphoserine phosphatase)